MTHSFNGSVATRSPATDTDTPNLSDNLVFDRDAAPTVFAKVPTTVWQRELGLLLQALRPR